MAEQLTIEQQRAIATARARSRLSSGEQPQESAPYDQQIFEGAVKRLREMGEGVKGAGLRVGSMLNLTDPETLAKYEQEVGQRRSVMSPTYESLAPQTPLEFLGSTGVDLATMYGLGGALKPVQSVVSKTPVVGPRLGSATEFVSQSLTAPRTIPQAMTGGAIYSQTIPAESGGQAAQSALFGAGTSGLAQPVLRAAGLTPQPETNLSLAQQQAAKRAIEAGFQFSPAQMTGSKTGMFIEEGIKALPLARGAYTKLEEANQAALQRIAGEAVGLKKGVEFTPNAMQSAYDNALLKYKSLESVPAIKLDKGFSQQIDKIVSDLNKVPESQRQQLGITEIQKVLKDYKNFSKKPVDGQTMFLGLRAINDSLFAAQKQGAVGAGAYKDLRNAVENAIERSITSPSKKGLVNSNVVKQFKEGRSQMSNWFTVNEAFDAATGEISGRKLAGSLARKSNFGGRNTELETAALAVRAFPRALPSSGTAERAESANLVKQLSAASALPLLGGGATSMLGGGLGDVAAAAGASQLLPALAANVATSEPVRSIIARRQLGAIAPDEGALARAFRYFEQNVPVQARTFAGNVPRFMLEQEILRNTVGEQ